MTSLYAPSADDVMRRLRPFGLFFEKSLKDLIKGIRSCGENSEELERFLSKTLSECRQEVESPDLDLKTNAVVKLTYLEMYGFDMSWANFYILEVMSSNRLQHKRVGYLAASQSFHKDPDILMLATNLLKKDLKYDGNNDVLKMGVTLSGLSTMVTAPLARDICGDLFSMLGSSKPYIRKKAISALFKVFLQYPEALRDNFDKFVAKLEDEDMSVVSATVSVICELSKKNPHPFVQLSPLLYETLFTIDNNWIIIRLLKLFTNLSQVEPKLRVKVLPKILELMEVTSATSVIYESINCIVKGHMLEPDDYDTALSCLEELTKFCNSNDPNLRYISVVLFYKIGKINTSFISEFNTLVIRLLKDVDISIRSRALELLEGITDDENIAQIVQILVKQFADKDVVLANKLFKQTRQENIEIEVPNSYKIKMVSTILRICSLNNYANVPDFDWYLAVLSDLCVISQDLNDEAIGLQLGAELRNIMVKVPSMRETCISTIVGLVSNNDICRQLPMVLKECLWCIGEYPSSISNGDDIIKLITRQRRLTPEVQQIAAQALIKIFSSWCNTNGNVPINDVKHTIQELISFFESLSSSKSFEVQERCVEFLEFFKLCAESLEQNDEELPLLITEVLPSFFNAYELNPILHGTLKKVQNSLSIDLETPFLSEDEVKNLLEEESSKHEAESMLASDLDMDDEFEEDDAIENPAHEDKLLGDRSRDDLAEEERRVLEEERRKEKLTNPFYLEGDYEDFAAKRENPLIDFNDNQDQNYPESSSLIAGELKHVSETSKKTKKERKKKKKKAEVLIDEGVPEITSDVAAIPEPQPAKSISSSKNSSRINLKMQTKLESFNFDQPQKYVEDSGAAGTEGQQEIDQLRAKFAESSLGQDMDEEVVIVKRKKKKRSKDKKHSKKKDVEHHSAHGEPAKCDSGQNPQAENASAHDQTAHESL
ncbi:Apl5p [Lachancea thermotolerans CBS 6340]|uniref:AP-3 complex subunit delta n=1 Tax=Lachancea thermotolerans (strain ATCC 56472 / CBS 6340 / NRRL Y-8284) TaxID=559295 RepID=C5E2F6_LACTC|nr:KLTH0H04554p [Lachancea thermotolerans CBS 6340]CAR30217.1 KLTH0H04554p [Lachancea thermotolerans CBS 6340]